MWFVAIRKMKLLGHNSWEKCWEITQYLFY